MSIDQPNRPTPPKVRASDADRNRIATQLSTAYAQGQLDYNEFTQRHEATWSAVYTSELLPLVADLGGGSVPVDQPTDRLPAARQPVTGTQGSGLSVGILSGHSNKGRWTCSANHVAVAFMGDITLDLRQADFVAANTTITCISMMGDIKVIVPDDIDIVVNGVGFLGDFKTGSQVDEITRPQGGIHVTISGLSMMGAVKVTRQAKK